MQSAEQVKEAAYHFKRLASRYSSDERHRLISRISGEADRLGVNIDLANVSQVSSAQGETGKTRAQPRQYGGRFGVKGHGGTEAQVFTPKQISEAIDNLKPGQSINLPNNAGKVRRLNNGFQIVSPNGQNIVVKTPALAASKANGMVGSKGVKK